MQTIIILGLSIVAGVVLFGILGLIRAMARAVWLKIGPFMVALVVAFSTLAVFVGVVTPRVQDGAAPWVTASAFMAALVFTYMVSRKLFARNWTDKIDPPIKPSQPTFEPPEQLPVSLKRFEPLPHKRRLWRRVVSDEGERFRHVLGYLRAALSEERSSLDYSELAITQMWIHSSKRLDIDFIQLQGKFLTWLQSSEKQLTEAQTMSRPQQLLLCEKVVQTLEEVAVEARALLAMRGESDLQAMRQRLDGIAKL